MATAELSPPPMDQDTARRLFNEGATLLFLNVPVGTEFGIDYNTWDTAENFKGVKMIPPGAHFVHYAAVNIRDHGMAPRMGFFRWFKRREVVVLSWSRRDEDAIEHDLGEEEEEEYRGRLRELDPCLGSYPYESLKKWVSLTNHITEALVAAMMPPCGKIFSAPQLVADDRSRTTAERAELLKKRPPAGEEGSAEDQLPQMHSQPGTEIRFSPIPKRNYPSGATPSEITKCSMDLTFTLEAMLTTHYPSDPTGILGEIQFAFVCFLIGQVYDGFEQWKRLVHVLCGSESALAARPDLYGRFVTALHFQLREVPADFFVDIVSGGNFLTTTLGGFFANLRASEGAGPALREKGRRFRENITKRFRWDFDAEPEEDRPVVVEL